MRDRDLVNLQDLSYRSMLPLLKANAPDRVEESILNGERVQVARVADLLYLPDRGLQILEGRIIPREAFPDPGIVIQAKLARIQDDRPTVYRSSDFDYRDDEVCILSNSWAKSFYHWTEELYKVVILEHHGFSGRYVVTGLPSFCYEFL